MGFMWITLVIIVVLIVLFARGSFSLHPKEGDTRGDSALEVLRKRYAKGEISKEEFEDKKKDLTQ